MPDDKKERNSEASQTALFYMALVAAGLAALLPGLIAVFSFLFTHTRLSRKAFAGVLVAAVGLSTVAYFADGMGIMSYLTWLVAIFGVGERGVWPPPIVEIIAYAGVFYGLLGVLGADQLAGFHPKIGEWLGERLVDPTEFDHERVQELSIAVFGSGNEDEFSPSRFVNSDDTKDGATHTDPDGIPLYLGRSPIKRGGEYEPVVLYTGDISRHGLILGSTGSGKSETIKRLVADLIDAGWDGCVLDLKEDIGEGSLAHFLEAYAAEAGINYQHWAVSYEAEDYEFYLDPLAGIGMDLAKNMIASMQDFEAPHWEMLCKQILGQLLYLMYLAHEADPHRFPSPNLRDVGRILSLDFSTETQAMRAVVKTTFADRVEDSEFEILARPTPNHRQAASGLGARISAVYESTVGRTGLKPSSERKAIDFAARGLTYIGLDQTGQPDTSRVISSAVLAAHGALVSRRKDDPRVKAKKDRRFLIVDEAASVQPELVKNLLSKARSAGIAVILATQGAMDWGDEWGAMANNTNFSIIMAQEDPESAERLSALIGTKKEAEESQTVRDDEVVGMSVREVEVPIVPAQTIREMKVGQAYLRVRDRYGSSRPFISLFVVSARTINKTSKPTSVEQRAKRLASIPIPSLDAIQEPEPAWVTPTEVAPPEPQGGGWVSADSPDPFEPLLAPPPTAPGTDKPKPSPTPPAPKPRANGAPAPRVSPPAPRPAAPTPAPGGPVPRRGGPPPVASPWGNVKDAPPEEPPIPPRR